MLDRTDHNRLADQTAARARAAVIADRYIPAASRNVASTDNLPPEELDTPAPGAAIEAYATAELESTPAIAAAKDQAALLKAFIADNPVLQTPQEAQTGATWIESTRRTLAAMEDERKPKVEPLNAALRSINDRYRPIREPLEAMLKIVCARWNSWDAAERQRREAQAAAARQAAEKAAAAAQAAIDEANDAIAGAEVGECTDAGTAVADAKDAMRDANRLERSAARAERNTSVRVASTLGGKAIASRRRRVIVIDDPCAALKAIGMTDRIADAIRQSALAFEEAYGELPAGISSTYERSV